MRGWLTAGNGVLRENAQSPAGKRERESCGGGGREGGVSG